MQQTETLKLNLIETGDPISPAPINENAEKLEAALHTKAGAAETAALTQRVVELEKFHIAWGRYHGNATDEQKLTTGFAPVVVLLRSHSSGEVFMSNLDYSSLSGIVTFESDGFVVHGSSLNSWNYGHYTFLAFGLDE